MVYRLVVALVLGGMIGTCVQAAQFGTDGLFAQSSSAPLLSGTDTISATQNGDGQGTMLELPTSETSVGASVGLMRTDHQQHGSEKVMSEKLVVGLAVSDDAENKEESDGITTLLKIAQKNEPVRQLFGYIYKKESRVSHKGNEKDEWPLIESWVTEYSKDVWDTALMTAAETGNLEGVKALLDIDKTMINIQDEYGYTPLMTAIVNEQWEVMYFLLSKKADISISDRYGVTPLMHVAGSGNLEAMQELLKAGISKEHIDAQLGDDNTTALMHAARFGNIVLLLIENGANVNVQNRRKKTALMHVVQYGGSKEIVAALVKAGDKGYAEIQDKNGNTALMLAVRERNSEAVQELLKTEANVEIQNKNGDTALTFAVMYGSEYEVMRSLLRKKGVDFAKSAKDGNTLLMSAVMAGNKGAVKALLEVGTREYGDMKNENGYTALMLAVIECRHDIVELLIEKVNLDVQGGYGSTALMFAARARKTEECEKMMQALLNGGANKEVEDCNGCTVLGGALYYGRHNAASLLIRAGAKLDKHDKYGDIYLMLAASCGNKDVIQALLDVGVDVDRVLDKYDQTPLMLAVKRGDKEVVEVLLGANVDVYLFDKDRKTALNHAIDRQDDVIIELLRDKEAMTFQELVKYPVLNAEPVAEPAPAVGLPPSLNQSPSFWPSQNYGTVGLAAVLAVALCAFGYYKILPQMLERKRA